MRGHLAQQAFNAERHISETPRRIQARAYRISQIAREQARGVTPSHPQNSGNPRLAPPASNPRDALCDQASIVGIKRHHIRHGAQRDQIE